MLLGRGCGSQRIEFASLCFVGGTAGSENLTILYYIRLYARCMQDSEDLIAWNIFEHAAQPENAAFLASHENAALRRAAEPPQLYAAWPAQVPLYTGLGESQHCRVAATGIATADLPGRLL